MYQKQSAEELIQEIYQWGSGSGVDNSHREAAKAELTKRLLCSIVELDKSTRHYSRWLIGLTIVLGILALVQIVVILCQIESA